MLPSAYVILTRSLQQTRRVYETRMPPGGNKVKIWQNLQVLHFDPTPGTWDVGKV